MNNPNIVVCDPVSGVWFPFVVTSPLLPPTNKYGYDYLGFV